MNTEELMELGLSEEQAELALAAFEEALEENNRRLEAAHADTLRGMALENALTLALADAHDVGLAASLIDRSALTVEEDGVVAGLAEQVQALREQKPFLFRAAAVPGFTLGAAPASGVSEALGGSLTLRDVISGRLHSQRG